MSSQGLGVIANPKSTEKELITAIHSLPKRPNEPPSFWTTIANSRAYTRRHRQRVLSQLFQRHVKVGMQLHELARILDYPHWFRPADLRVWTELGGVLPVALVKGDSTFEIGFLPEPNKGRKVVFLRIHKEVSDTDFTNLIVRKRRTNIGKNVIVEIGYWLNFSLP